MADPAKTDADRSSPHESEYARLHRLLQIIPLLQQQDGWDAKHLADACGVAERTIYRDLKLLEGANIPFSYDSETKCYRIRGDFYMRPVELTLDEALAMVALGEQIAANEQIPFTRAAARAVAKVRGQLPTHVRRELAHIDRHLSIRLGEVGNADDVADVYTKVQKAMAQGKCLRCRYEGKQKTDAGKDAGGAGEFFIFKPYRLHFDRRAWYAVGHHSRHAEVRSLKLSRFTDMQPTDIRFEIPRDFSFEKHLGNAWRMIRGQATHEVELLFDAEFAENIADTLWHKSQKIDWQEDGSIIFRCRVDGLDEIQWWILARGPHCKVIRPRELIQRIKDLASKTAQQYD